MSILSCSSAERVEKASIKMQISHPFFAYILLNFNMKESSEEQGIPTFAVNKYGNLFFNPEFADTLSDDQLIYVLAHEAMHIAKGDFFRRGDRDPLVWNVVSDCVINDILNQEGLSQLTIGYIPDRSGNIKINDKTYNVRDKSTEEFYDEVCPDLPVSYISSLSASSGSGDPNNPGHGGFDVHLEGDSDGQGGNTGEEGDGKSKTAAETKASSDWKKITVEAATAARQKGNSPGFVDAILGDILEPKVDWRSRLRSLITNEIPVDYMNRLPGRSFYGTGVWCPRVLRENINLFISVDCSGSTSGDREDFISECVGIMTSHTQIKGRLICWDTNVDENNDIEVDSQCMDKFYKLDLRNICGGTELSSYTDYIEQKQYNSRMHIFLTDGVIESRPRVPQGKCLFVLCKNGSDEIVKNYGDVIRME
jgi:predicted metal-dependent peptidase